MNVLHVAPHETVNPSNRLTGPSTSFCPGVWGSSSGSSYRSPVVGESIRKRFRRRLVGMVLCSSRLPRLNGYREAARS